MQTRQELRERIAQLEEENEELLDVIENINSLTQGVVEDESEDDDDLADDDDVAE